MFNAKKEFDNFELHFLKGSVSMEDILERKIIMESFKVIDITDNLRYLSTGDRDFDIGCLSKDQKFKGIRIKGYTPTTYGAKRPFDAIVMCNVDASQELATELDQLNNSVDKFKKFLDVNYPEKN